MAVLGAIIIFCAVLPAVLMNSIFAKDLVTMARQVSPASPTCDLYKIYVVSHRDCDSRVRTKLNIIPQLPSLSSKDEHCTNSYMYQPFQMLL